MAAGGAATALVLALVGTGLVASTAGAGTEASSALVAVAGGPERLPAGTQAVGALPATSTLSVAVALRPADPAALEAFDEDVTSSGSPLFRHFLAPGQFESRFGPGTAVIAATPGLAAEGGAGRGTDGQRWPHHFGIGIGVLPRPCFWRGLRAGSSAERSDRPGAHRPARDSECAGGKRGRGGGAGRPVRWPGPQTCPATPGGPELTLAPSALAARRRSPAPSGCSRAGATAHDLAQAHSMSSLYPADEGQGADRRASTRHSSPIRPSDITAFEVVPRLVAGTVAGDHARLGRRCGPDIGSGFGGGRARHRVGGGSRAPGQHRRLRRSELRGSAPSTSTQP